MGDSGIAFAKSSLDVPFNYSVSHHSDAVGVRNQNRSAQATRLFEPGRSGHLPVAVHAVPRSEYPTAKLFALRQNCGNPRSDGPLTDHQFPITRDQSCVTDRHALHIRDAIQRSRIPFEGNSQISRTSLGLSQAIQHRGMKNQCNNKSNFEHDVSPARCDEG